MSEKLTIETIRERLAKPLGSTIFESWERDAVLEHAVTEEIGYPLVEDEEEALVNLGSLDTAMKYARKAARDVADASQALMIAIDRLCASGGDPDGIPGEKMAAYVDALDAFNTAAGAATGDDAEPMTYPLEALLDVVAIRVRR